MTSNICIRRLQGHLVITAALMLAACGGGGGSEAEPTRVVVLDSGSFDSIAALADAAAREHGAPAEGEPVLYRLRAGTAAVAQAEQLRELGFSHVEAE